MAKKKKATPFVSKQVLETKHRIDFLNKIIKIINAVTEKKIAHLLTPSFYEVLYLSRALPLTLEFGKVFSAKKQNIINQSINRMLRVQYITLSPSGYTMNIAEFFTYWQTIHYYFTNMPDSIFKNFESVLNELKPHFEDYEIHLEHATILRDFAMFPLSLDLGHVDFIIEFVQISERMEENIFSLLSQKIYPKVHKAEWRKFKIDGETHSAFQFGGFMPSKGFRWFSVDYENFIENSSMGKLPVPIFIQQHAIKRFRERIDIINPLMLIINTFNSFEFPKIIKYQKSYYIEYRVYEHKIGYFIGKLIDGAFVLQTFLFLTNNGTPEGDKLNKALGIKKLDKKYLAIDKLSTFIKLSDIEATEVIEILDMKILHEIRKSTLKHNNFKDLQFSEYIGNIKNYLLFKGDEGYENSEIDNLENKLVEENEN